MGQCPGGLLPLRRATLETIGSAVAVYYAYHIFTSRQETCPASVHQGLLGFRSLPAPDRGSTSSDVWEGPVLLGGGGITGRDFHRQQTAVQAAQEGPRLEKYITPLGACRQRVQGTQHQATPGSGPGSTGSSSREMSTPIPRRVPSRWTLRTDQDACQPDQAP